MGIDKELEETRYATGAFSPFCVATSFPKQL
jgi:hypothetical protein